MITESIFSVIFGAMYFVLDKIPFFQFSIDLAVFDTFADIYKTCSHLLPINTIATILGIIIAINAFKVVVSLLKTLWQILPFV